MLTAYEFSGESSTGAGTSALAPLRTVVPKWPLIALGGALAVPGTSSVDPFFLAYPHYVMVSSTESATRPDTAFFVPELPSHGSGDSSAALAEVRRLSGLTWDQLARVFGVARRSVHFWASGKPMSSNHVEKLHRVLSVLRKVDRGDTLENRSVLLMANEGTIILDLLRDGRFDTVLALLGERTPAGRGATTKVGRALEPVLAFSVGAEQGTVHREVGRYRAVRAPRSTK